MTWSQFTNIVLFGAACLAASAVPAAAPTDHYAFRDLSPRLQLDGCEEYPSGAIRCTSLSVTRHLNPQGQYDAATLILRESESDALASHQGTLVCRVAGNSLALDRDATSGSLSIHIEIAGCDENERSVYDHETGVYSPSDGYSGSLTINAEVRDPVNRVDQRMNIFGTNSGGTVKATCQMHIGRYFQHARAEINGQPLLNLDGTEARQMSCHVSGAER